MQLVIEKLINGTPLSSIKRYNASFVALINTSQKIKELSGLSLIRECRTAIQIIGKNHLFKPSSSVISTLKKKTRIEVLAPHVNTHAKYITPPQYIT